MSRPAPQRGSVSVVTAAVVFLAGVLSLVAVDLLRNFRRGLTTRLEICDAHPELLRAAKHLGRQATRPCPVCDKEDLRLLAYVYADGAGRDNGRAYRVEEGLTLAAEHPGGACYVVEVCTDCSWNHLAEALVARSAG